MSGRRRLLVGAGFLLLGLLWLSPLARDPTGVPYQPGAQFTDLLIAHLPNAYLIQRGLALWQQVPLWNPLILSGQPLAADPLASLWYPPNWPTAIWPSPLTFNLLLWLHLVWGGVGAYRLARGEGLGRAAAFLAGAVFSGSPKLVAHVALGHVTLVYAVSWTPWVVAAWGRLGEGAAGEGDWLSRRVFAAGLTLGALFLADPRWAVPAGILAVAYSLRQAAHSHNMRTWMSPRLAARWAAVIAVAGAIAAGAAAALWLPLEEFARLSTRADLGAAQRTAMALPVGRLLGIVIPDLGGWGEWQTYMGLLPLMLATLGLMQAKRRSWFWLAAGVLALLLATARPAWFYDAVSSVIPGMRLLRVPARMVFIAGLAVAMLAARGLERLSDIWRGVTTAARSRMVLFGVALAISGLGFCLSIVAGASNAGVARAGLLVGALALGGFVVLAYGLAGKGPAAFVLGTILALVVFDLAFVDATLLTVKGVRPAMQERARLGEAMQAAGRVRIFSPSYAVPQHVAARFGLELADGVNPLQLSAYREYMSGAVGFDGEEYSVTLPPFPTGDPRAPWRTHLDLEALGVLNVGWILSDFPLHAAGLQLERTTEGVLLYRNPQVRPRVWVEHGDGQGYAPEAASLLEWTPNAIRVRAKGPGLLVLSEVEYPGWQAEVDGQRTPIEPVHGLLRGVRLGTGEHEVRFIFRPWRVFVGLGISLMTLALAVIGSRWL